MEVFLFQTLLPKTETATLPVEPFTAVARRFLRPESGPIPFGRNTRQIENPKGSRYHLDALTRGREWWQSARAIAHKPRLGPIELFHRQPMGPGIGACAGLALRYIFATG